MACWRGSDALLKAAAYKRIPLFKSMQAIICSCRRVLLCASFTFAIETTLPFDEDLRRRQHGRPVVLA